MVPPAARRVDTNDLCAEVIALTSQVFRVACQRVGVEHKHLYLRANTEARAIADRYRRYQADLREGKLTRIQVQVGELIQERREAGYDGISAREVWQRLDSDLKSVRHTYRHVAQAIAANDDTN